MTEFRDLFFFLLKHMFLYNVQFFFHLKYRQLQK